MQKNNLTLIFDEMITGLRFNCSSARSAESKSLYINFENVLAGVSIGIIGLKKEVLIKLKKKGKKIFFGGTFRQIQSIHLSNKIVNYILKNKKNFS